MKIIGIDNLNRDNVDDILICENIQTSYINHIISMLNNNIGNHDGYYYKAVKDDYKLYKFEY